MASNEVPSGTGLAEIKEVLGRLWKLVDAFKLASADDNRKIGEKLDQWIETNRAIQESLGDLLQVILSNAQEVRRSAECYEQGSQLSAQLGAKLQHLERSTTQLHETLKQLPLVVGDSVSASHPSQTPTGGMGRALAQMQQTQEKLAQKLLPLIDRWDGEADASLAQPWIRSRITELLRPTLLGIYAVVAILGGGIGVVAAPLWQPWSPEAPRRLTLSEAKLLRWANTWEGRLAQNLIRWNGEKLEGLDCTRDVQRLGVTLKVSGRPAIYGFCTLWVVPPPQRVFQTESMNDRKES